MTMRRTAGMPYISIVAGVIFFQIALAAGAPRSEYTTAGLFVAGWSRVSRRLIWIVVVFAAVSFVLNLITPSVGERVIWAPVALILLITSVVVALKGPSGSPAP